MACFFWTSVREKPEKRKRNSITVKLSKQTELEKSVKLENMLEENLATERVTGEKYPKPAAW